MYYCNIIKNIFFYGVNYLVSHNLLLPICILISSLFVGYILLKVRIKKTAKIKNFFFAYCALGVYITFYIFILFTLRISHIGNSLDMGLLYSKFIRIFIETENLTILWKILNICMVIILILMWFLFWIKIRLLLRNQIWKLYLYYDYLFVLTNNPFFDAPENYMFNIIVKKYKINILSATYKFISYYFVSFTDFFYAYLRIEVLANPIMTIINNLSMKYTDHLFTVTADIYIKIIRYTPTILLFLIILCELYFNNLKLYYTFYYLLIYLFLILYVQISECLSWYHNQWLSKVLIERAYFSPNIIYINWEEIHENILTSFLTKHSIVKTFPREIRDGLSMILKRYELIPIKLVAFSITDEFIYYQQTFTHRFFSPSLLITNDNNFYINEDFIRSIEFTFISKKNE